MRELTDEQKEQAELQQIQQRPSPFQAKHIGKSIRQILARRGLNQTQAALEISQVWEKIAGPQLSAVSRPGNIVRGVLEVFTKDSSAKQELHICRKQLLVGLQRELPQAGITGIRSRTG